MKSLGSTCQAILIGACAVALSSSMPSVALSNRALGIGASAAVAAVELGSEVRATDWAGSPAVDSGHVTEAIAERVSHTLEHGYNALKQTVHRVHAAALSNVFTLAQYWRTEVYPYAF